VEPFTRQATEPAPALKNQRIVPRLEMIDLHFVSLERVGRLVDLCGELAR